jgi:hypothetical protein
MVLLSCGAVFIAVSFQATRSTSQPSASAVVPFNNTMPVDHWSFSKHNSSLTAPVSGYYWLHVSVGIPPSTPANVRLQCADRAISLVRNFTSYTAGPDTSSAAHVVYLTQGDTVYVSSDYPLYGDSLLQISFGGFLLDSLMSPLVAFSVGQPTTFFSPSLRPIPMNVTHVDTHNAWKVASSEYVTPVSGVYILSVTISTVNQTTGLASFFVNGTKQFFLHNMYDKSHTAPDTMSSLIIYYLNAKDKVSLYLQSNNAVSSALFSGFRYSPSIMPAVAFSVAMNVIAALNSLNTATGNPIPYNYTFVNIGNGWNPAAYSFVTPLDGVYYVQVAVNTGGSPCQVNVLLNGNATVSVFIRNNLSGYVSSRALIMRLKTGDSLRTRVASGTCWYDSNKLLTFSGFLVHT